MRRRRESHDEWDRGEYAPSPARDLVENPRPVQSLGPAEHRCASPRNVLLALLPQGPADQRLGQSDPGPLGDAAHLGAGNSHRSTSGGKSGGGLSTARNLPEFPFYAVPSY
ncbi:hypothetical protein MTO96_021664 [Rhipicephalus appendiculatus]